MFPIPLSPRLILAGVAAAGLLALVGGYTMKVRHDQAERDRAAVAAAQAQARVSDVTAKATDEHVGRTIVIKEAEGRAVQVVQAAPGAGDPIPDGLLRAWRDGLSDIEAGPAGDNRAGEPAGAVPAT